MKALTIFQPWASLIAIGAKPYEFRHWDYSTRYHHLQGARILVHASARPVKYAEITDLLARLKDGSGTTGLLKDKAVPALERIRAGMQGKGDLVPMPLGAAICTATLGRAIRAGDLFTGKMPADSDRVEHHLFAWPMLQVTPVPAITVRGAQGFWNVPASLERDFACAS